VLWIMATNPVVSLPDNQFVKRALERCPFVIVSDITAESDVASYADLLLPAAGWGEKQGMVTNSERRISRQRQFQNPP
ncbi:molybdopterin-dependent oxidoreductase, partial [Escherichia coli]|nr:molybdopterin-dependent oxidoreductase [Escherichia coli]